MTEAAQENTKATQDPTDAAPAPAGGPKRSLRSGKQIVPSETIAGTTLAFVISIMPDPGRGSDDQQQRKPVAERYITGSNHPDQTG